MTDEAKGIHSHPAFKLGKRPPVDKPVMRMARFLTGVEPIHDPTVDYLKEVTFGLDGNNQYGVCGPTGLDNLTRLITAKLTGEPHEASQTEIFDLYRTQNPTFDPQTGAGDEGVILQDMLAEAVRNGAFGRDYLGFAAVNVNDPDEIRAAVQVFGGLLLGLDLQEAQQAQLDSASPIWDYKKSSEWGGHCVMEGAFDPTYEDIITWAMRVRMTAGFSNVQRQEAYVVLLPEHLENKYFVQNFDMKRFVSEWETLTGRQFPITPPSPPAPAPQPAPRQDPVTITDPQVVAHINKVARSHKVTAESWTALHFRHYFGIKE